MARGVCKGSELGLWVSWERAGGRTLGSPTCSGSCWRVSGRRDDVSGCCAEPSLAPCCPPARPSQPPLSSLHS